MEKYILILSIPIIYFLILIGYQLIKLIKLWLSYKLQTLKEKYVR